MVERRLLVKSPHDTNSTRSKNRQIYRQIFLPPNPETTRGLEVVPVHGDMDSQVENDWDPRLFRNKGKLWFSMKISGTLIEGRFDWYSPQSSYQQVECSTKL